MENDKVSDPMMVHLFEENLASYEACIVPTSNHFHEYHRPASFMKSALLSLVTAGTADTLTMMHILVDHINEGSSTAYSDYSINMLASSVQSKDSRARELIMSVLYVTKLVMSGDPIELSESWLRMVDHNLAVLKFLRNYATSDQEIVEESYSGNVINPLKEIRTYQIAESKFTLPIGYGDYLVEFMNPDGSAEQLSNWRPSLSVIVSPDIHPDPTADLSAPLVILCDVTVMAGSGSFSLDRHIGFFDDAWAQVMAQGCSSTFQPANTETVMVLPGQGYKAFMKFVSSDSGQSWRISQFNILPPSLSTTDR